MKHEKIYHKLIRGRWIPEIYLTDGQELQNYIYYSPADKKEISMVVKRVLKEYGSVIRRLN